MGYDDINPLDAQDPTRRAMQRFRSNVASALLLDRLLAVIAAREPDYFADLEGRCQTGLDYVELLAGDGDFDGHVPVPTRDGADVDFWIAAEDLRLLIGKLFPHGASEVPTFDDGRALVAVILHSALESIVLDLGIPKARDESIVAVVTTRVGLTSRDSTYIDLVDLRETRNVIAHHAGVVTERYQRFVPKTHFVRARSAYYPAPTSRASPPRSG